MVFKLQSVIQTQAKHDFNGVKAAVANNNVSPIASMFPATLSSHNLLIPLQSL